MSNGRVSIETADAYHVVLAVLLCSFAVATEVSVWTREALVAVADYGPVARVAHYVVVHLCRRCRVLINIYIGNVHLKRLTKSAK